LYSPSGQPWEPGDGKHADKAGTKLAARAALIQVKGDWAEYAFTFGFMTWAHKNHPCLFCFCTRDSLYQVAGLSPLGVAHALVMHRDYDHACSSCEIWVAVYTKEQHLLIIGSLFFDKRKGVIGGRVLKQDIPELSLLKQDRLEPHAGLLDIGAFEQVVIPTRVLFWRSAADTLARHRCPLFSQALGITVETSVEIDTLHALNLGVYGQYAQDVFWACVRADVWRVGQRTQDERLALSVMRLKGELFQWYKDRKVEDRGVHLHELQELSAAMLGSWAKPKLGPLKAAEAKTTMQFAADLARTYADAMPDGQIMSEAGLCLVRIQAAFDTQDVNMTPDSIQDACERKKKGGRGGPPRSSSRRDPRLSSSVRSLC
jgi:hypothetical protein